MTALPQKSRLLKACAFLLVQVRLQAGMRAASDRNVQAPLCREFWLRANRTGVRPEVVNREVHGVWVFLRIHWDRHALWRARCLVGLTGGCGGTFAWRGLRARVRPYRIPSSAMSSSATLTTSLSSSVRRVFFQLPLANQQTETVAAKMLVMGKAHQRPSAWRAVCLERT